MSGLVGSDSEGPSEGNYEDCAPRNVRLTTWVVRTLRRRMAWKRWGGPKAVKSGSREDGEFQEGPDPQVQRIS